MEQCPLSVNDETIHIISKVRRKSNQFLEGEMVKIGVEGLAPSHCEIIIALLYSGPLTMTQIA